MSTIKRANIVQVYSGRPGCMCGCRGEYRVAAKWRALADERRGYPHEDGEINDRQVERVLRILESSPDTQVDPVYAGERCYWLTTATRTYCAYEHVPADAEPTGEHIVLRGSACSSSPAAIDNQNI